MYHGIGRNYYRTSEFPDHPVRYPSLHNESTGKNKFRTANYLQVHERIKLTLVLPGPHDIAPYHNTFTETDSI